MLTTTFNRRYEIRRVNTWGFGVISVLVALGWVLGIGEHAAAPFLAIAGLGTALVLWQSVALFTRAGVQETPEGIKNWRRFRYLSWQWEEIDRFVHVKSRVYLVTRDQQVCLLFDVNEGWRNSWQDGETREITALLNARLEAWRKATAESGVDADSGLHGVAGPSPPP